MRMETKRGLDRELQELKSTYADAGTPVRRHALEQASHFELNPLGRAAVLFSETGGGGLA